MITRSRWLRGVAVTAAAMTAVALAACAPAGSSNDEPTSDQSSSAEGSSDDGNSGTDEGSSEGSSDSESGDATGESEGGDSQGPSGTIVVARTADIDNRDPHLSTAFVTLNTLELVYDTIVDIDNDGKIAPSLATKWEFSDDGKTLTFTLRDGVTWDNGDPFTSADVTASLNRILDESTGAVARSNLTSIAAVDAPDDSTVVLTLKAPNASILYALAGTTAAILHAKDIEAGTVGESPNGTGPYTWGTWKQGQSVTLTANPNYWGDAPKAETIEFRVIPSESSILSGMKANAFQLGVISDPAIAAQADGQSAFTLVRQAATAYHALMLNGRHAPLDQIKVRQAIACAVDRQEVIDTAAFGDGQITGPITSPGYQYSATDGLPCEPGDIDAAKQLLTEAGQADGFTIKTIVMSDNYATAVAEAENLRSQLAKIGVTLDIEQMPTSPYVDAWLAADFDAAIAKNGGSPDPYLMYGRYFTTDGSLKGPAGLTSQKLNDLLMEGNSTFDESKREDIYQQLQEELLRESPWVWTFTQNNYYLVSNDLNGFVPRADGSLVNLDSTGVTS